MGRAFKFMAVGTAAVAGAAAFGGPATAGPVPSRERERPSRHVLLLSIDGMHQSDLDWYVGSHPTSALARLVQRGTEFTNAQTPVPSDSFPGMLAQVTGGNPKTTGVYYDDSYDRALLPAGTTSCTSVTPGAEANYSESLDRDPFALDAGQGLPGLPRTILRMTSNPTTLIDPAKLPVDPATCQPVYPNDHLKVNTVFGVAKAAGLRTAWSDKHPAYQILNGPGSTANIDDLFTPEINSDAPTESADPNGHGFDWTKDNLLTQQYDSYKTGAVVNEINGTDHSGARKAATPAIFGMNFQSVSTAQKLFQSHTEGTDQLERGGYIDETGTPGPVLANALDFVNTEVQRLTGAIRRAGKNRSTTIILSAKHGQSPIDPTQLRRINDGPIIDALNTEYAATHPGTPSLVTFSLNDDGMLLWLRDPAGKAFASAYLLSHSAPGMDINGNITQVASSGLSDVVDGPTFFGAPAADTRVPDLLGVARVGTVYTKLNPTGKIAEHGGVNPADRHVPLVVSGAGAEARQTVGDQYETTSIAPTILRLLGLDANALDAVRQEGTPVLPLG